MSSLIRNLYLRAKHCLVLSVKEYGAAPAVQRHLFLFWLAADLYLAFLYMVWQGVGIAQAGTVFLIVAWVSAVGGLLVWFIPPNARFYRQRLRVHVIFSDVMSWLFVAGLLWAGEFVVGTLYLVAHLIVKDHDRQCAWLYHHNLRGQ